MGQVGHALRAVLAVTETSTESVTRWLGRLGAGDRQAANALFHEVYDTLGCVTRTVERKLERIRKKWEQEVAR